MEGESGEDFCGTGQGPFRALIVSNLKQSGSCRGRRPAERHPWRSLSSRRKSSLGAKGKIKSADAFEIHR